MNNKIPYTSIISRLSEITGLPKRQCEDYLREMISIVTERLEAGEEVSVPRLGNFKIVRVNPRKSVDVSSGNEIQIAAHNKVNFTPTAEVAEDVNEFFSMFGNEALPENFDETLLDNPSLPESPESPLVSETPEISETSENPDTAEIPATEPQVDEVQVDEDQIDYAQVDEAQVDEAETPGVATETATPDTVVPEVVVMERPKRSRGSFLWGVVVGIVIAAIAVAFLYFTLFDNLLNTKLKENQTTAQLQEDEYVADSTETGESEDMANIPATRPSDSPTTVQSPKEAPVTNAAEAVYDTITHTRYLTTMARDHYGNFNLWPYIYEENKNILGHPDRIRPGTPVRIPDLKKYGVDPKDPDDIAEAKRRGTAIYSRYK